MTRLTRREKEVLRLFAAGSTYAGVGERLGISVHTVASHVKKAYRKLGVNTAASAVGRASRLGLI